MGFLGITKIDTTSYNNGIPPEVCDTALPTILTVNRPADTPNNGWANELLFTGNTLIGDVYFEFELNSFGAFTAQMVGLDFTDDTNSWQDLSYAIYLLSIGGNMNFRIYESGAFAFGPTNVVAGDVFRIEKNGTVITYLINGAIVYTSGTASNNNLQVGSSFFINATYVDDIELGNIKFCNL